MRLRKEQSGELFFNEFRISNWDGEKVCGADFSDDGPTMSLILKCILEVKLANLMWYTFYHNLKTIFLNSTYWSANTTPLKWLEFQKRSTKPNNGKDVKQPQCPYFVNGNLTWDKHFQKGYAKFLLYPETSLSSI